MDTLSVSYKYGDVAFRWTEKVKGDLTGLKYQLPGEELEPDALITVSDDNDLQVRNWPARSILCAVTGTGLEEYVRFGVAEAGVLGSVRCFERPSCI